MRVLSLVDDETNRDWLHVNREDSDLEKDWVTYEGPRGGEGWQHTTTGEVRYQENKPGTSAYGAEELTPESVQDWAVEQGILGWEEEDAAVDWINAEGLNQEQLQAMKDSLEYLHEKDLLNNVGVVSTEPDPGASERNEGAPAYFNEKMGWVYINPERFLRYGEEEGDLEFDRNVAARNPMGVVVHEFGHANHLPNLGWKKQVLERGWEEAVMELTDMEPSLELGDDIAEEVSGYASTHPVEFVAEVFTGLHTGETYPDWVMELYDDFGGPRVET